MSTLSVSTPVGSYKCCDQRDITSNLTTDFASHPAYNTCCDENIQTSNFISDAHVSTMYYLADVAQAARDYDCRVHPDSVLVLETFAKIDKTIQCGLIPSFFFIGAPANIVSMIVFFRQGLRDRMNLCLFCLAFVDLMYVTVLFIVVSYCFIGLVLPSQLYFWRWTLLSRGLNFIYGFAYLSGCLTMIIAVERCLCVMFPMKAMNLISTKTMVKVLAATFLLILGLCSVYGVKEQVSTVIDPASGETSFIITLTEVFVNHHVFSIIEDVVLSLVSFLCFIVVLITTIITVVQLQRAMSWRKSTASGSSYLKGQAVLMKMLVAVSSVYVLCTAPNVALSLARFTVPEFRADGSQCNTFLATHMMGFITCMLNSSINFFVYSAMSSRFRQEMKTIFLCITAGTEIKWSNTESKSEP